MDECLTVHYLSRKLFTWTTKQAVEIPYGLHKAMHTRS